MTEISHEVRAYIDRRIEDLRRDLETAAREDDVARRLGRLEHRPAFNGQTRNELVVTFGLIVTVIMGIVIAGALILKVVLR